MKTVGVAVAVTAATILIAVLSAYTIWIIVLPSAHIVDASYSARVTNISDSTIFEGVAIIGPEQPFITDFSAASVEVTSENVTVTIDEDTRVITVTFRILGPTEEVSLRINHLRTNQTVVFPQSASLFALRVRGYPSATQWEESFRVNVESAIGSFTSGSVFVHNPLGGAGQVSEIRDHVKEFLFLSMLFPALLGAGTVSWVTGFRKFPFVTFAFMEMNTLTYVFVGSGWEINLLPELQFYKTYLPFGFLYHGSYLHIAGNFVYFLLVGFLMESLIDMGAYRARMTHYLLPFGFDFVRAIILYGSSLLVRPFTLGFGLSNAIILMTISVWTFTIKNWKKVVASGKDAFWILLAGLCMGSLFGWVVVLVTDGQVHGKYAIQLAISHVVVGLIGVASVIVFHRRIIVDRLKTTLSNILGKRSALAL